MDPVLIRGPFSSGRDRGMAHHMLRSLLLLMTALMLGATTQPGAPVPTTLTERQHHDLRCAAAFAVVAVAQTRGDAAALALPPLGLRGKHYLGLVGERVASETGLSGDAVHDLLAAAANEVAQSGSVAVASACLADLDGVVPPRPAPDAVTCLALLGVYADVLAARDAGSPLARALARESASLAPLVHSDMAARGLDSAAEAGAIDQHRATVREALNGGPAVIDADDFALCRRLAATRGS